MKRLLTKSNIKRFIVCLILGIYILNNFSQFALYTWDTVNAARIQENQTDHTNIIAILVDNQIYPSIKNDVQWYATKYIQWSTNNTNNAISNSKAIVFPINTSTFSAKNIVQMLENMYFDGIKDKSSNLAWVILIWDIPLPVVNQNWYIFPTIYPYVDFEEQKFIWDDESKYFIYNNNPKWQAEIWHWIINFGNDTNEYSKYFSKLSWYRNDPTNFVDKAIRYDDFIWNNEHFNDANLNFYQNNFIFSEDIGYHRYSNLMLKVLQWERNNEIADLMGDLNEAFEEGWVSIDMSDSFAALWSSTDDMAVPTAHIKTMVDKWYLASYIDLFSQKYLKLINNNAQTANRWIQTWTWRSWTIYLDAIDTHYKTIETLDEIALRKNWWLEPFLIMVNNALEEIVDKKVEEEKYWLDEVLPLTYLKYNWVEKTQLFKKKCYRDEYEAYENFYFWENAKNLENAEQTTTYRWTYRERQAIQAIDWITIQNVQSWAVPSTDVSTIDLNKKWIGWSYDIFAQQVDANRWYNYNNSIKELDIYNTNKVSKKENRWVNCVSKFLWICRKRRWSITTSDEEAQCNRNNTEEQWWCESVGDFALRFRWWASSLNLTSDWNTDFERKSWYYYSGAVYPVFDIAWSKKIKTAENDSTSFKAINTYAQLIQRKFSPNTQRKKFRSFNKDKKNPDSYEKWYDEWFDYDVHFTNQIPTFNSNKINWWTGSTPLTWWQVEFFSKFTWGNNTKYRKESQWDIIKISYRDMWWLDNAREMLNWVLGWANSWANELLDQINFWPDVPVPNIEDIPTPLLNLLNPCKWEWEVYTYKTIDSRVKNDSVNQDELTSSTYLMFKDKSSHVLKFYNWIMSHLSDLSWEINELFDPNSEDWALHMFSKIDNDIITINNWLSGIVNYDINTISGMQNDPRQISELAESWNNVFNGMILNELSGSINQAYESLNELKWLIEEWTGIFDTTINYISAEKEKFKLNLRPLTFYSYWVIRNIPPEFSQWTEKNIPSKSISIRHKFLNQRPQSLNAIKSEYTNMHRITTWTIVQDLMDKREAIDALITATGEDFTGNIWCRDMFSELCDTLDKILREHTIHSANINSGIYRINAYEVFDENDEDDPWTKVHDIFRNMFNTYNTLNSLSDSRSIKGITDVLSDIPISTNYDLTWVSEWINQTTSDRPIDSPRYLTFKWIAGNKVTLIYPDIYKAEVFSWNTENGTLQLMTPEQIANSIRKYLRDVATQYNSYLIRERNGSSWYYNNNKEAFDLLGRLSSMASPNTSRRYWLFSGDYLINELETRIKNSPYFSWDILANEDPILFIANIIYYQNVSRPTKIVWTTILDDIDNQKANVDMNEKVSYTVKNYLTANNNRWKYLSPNYRDKWYEVAFINTNWNDNIDYEAVPDMVQWLQTFSNNYQAPTNHSDNPSELEEELMKECNIPTDEWVLLFDLSNGISSPRREAMKCRREKIKEKPYEIKVTFPFERDNTESFRENVFNTLNPEAYEEIIDLYTTQLRFQNPAQRNQEILESAGNQEETLRDILNYVEIDTTPKNIRADEAEWMINITSSKTIGNIEMYMVNIWESKIKIQDGNRNVSNNITVWTNWFTTGNFAWNYAFDPVSRKQIKFSINNPIEWLNVFVFYLCPRWTTDIQNKCAMYSLSINVVPWSIDKIDIEMTWNRVLEWADIPFIVNWVDKFGNNVWDIIIPKFNASVDYGTLTLDWNTASNIDFSKFDNTKFTLNAIESWINLDWKRITVSISGSIWWISKVRASTWVNVVKWRLKVKKAWNTVSNISVKLPDRDYYSRDTNWIDQINTGKLEKLDLELVNSNWNTLKLEWKVTVRSKNWILQPWKITKKDIPQNTPNWWTTNLQQYKFTKSNYFDLSWWKTEVYFYPSFTAWEDTIIISMKWVEDVEIPVTVNHASPTIVQITTESSSLKKNSSTNANLKIYDNRNNPINESTKISLSSANDKISLSKSWTINVTWWSLDFDIYSHDKWWKWYVYSFIDTDTTPLNQQKPGSISISLQKMMLPENDLNVMYLNLFGNDWWNQRWLMSDNNKYSENLIKNSDKLITVTTQLVSLENIKHFPAIIDNRLNINNFDENSIYLTLSWQQFIFGIDWVWQILANKSSFNLSYINGTNYENTEDIESEILNNINNWNILYYISEQTDSIIESNEVRWNAIYINENKEVFNLRNWNFDKDLKITLRWDKLAWYQVWEVSYQDSIVWQMIIVVNNESNLNINLVTTSAKYDTTNIWINGTTRDYWLGFYEIESTLPLWSFWYKSIQDSYDSELWIWFTSDFKNITNFGWWMSVWESTLPFWSELLINIWDPLLKRIDGNKSAKIYDESGHLVEDTKFDKWIWQIIYSDPNKDILKVIDIDFNSDWLKDVIVIFKDWTIKILKNYGWTDPFQDLWALSILADRISDVSVWDVDWNWYPDLIIWTESWLLRVYLNESWVFDVDWYPVCLNVNVAKGEISQDPEHINNIHQIFLKDMDLDGALDIVTNDNLWFIKIFYWGKTNWNSNYLSTNKYTCDTWRYDRLSSSSNWKPNTKLVYQFGIKIDNENHILDQSLIRRQWISPNELSNQEQDALVEQLWIDLNTLNNVNDLDHIWDAINNVLNFDVTAASSLYLWLNRLKTSSFDITPIYEPSDAEIEYTEIGCLTWSDPVKIYKTYENVKDWEIDSTTINTTDALINWDLVRVNVYIKANSAFTGTYIDNIAWPWMIPLSEEDPSKLKYFRFDSWYVQNGKITTEQLEDMYRNSHRDLDNARFMLDNIHMKAWDSLKFSYWIVYNNDSIININIEDMAAKDFKKYTTWQMATTMQKYLQKDNYPDITIQPEDWCNDSLFIFFNDKRTDNTARTYELTYVNLGSITEQYNNNSEQNKKDEEDELMNWLTNAAENNDTQSVRSQLWWLAGITESIDWQGMLSAEGDFSSAINIRSEVIDSDPLINEAMKKVEDAIWSLCNGIDLWKLWLWRGWGCWLPVPFNQAFLWPGKYHLFGCFNIEPLNSLIGDWMPLLNIPGNRWPTVAWYIPAPGFFGYPAKAPEIDGFSFWNPAWTYPSMFRIYLMPTLTAKVGIAMCFGPYTVWKYILDPIGDVGWNCIVFAVSLPCPNLKGWDDWDNWTPYVPKEYSMLKWCSNQNIPCYVASNESTSPFVLGSSSANSNTFVPAVPDGNFAWWIINIDKRPETLTSYRENSYNPSTNTIELKWWADSQNKILWSMEQWLIQKVIKSWLDKQINYIMTNLTNRKISVTRPDFSEMVWDRPSRSEITESYKSLDIEQNKKNCESMKWNRDDSNNTCIDTEESLRIKCENRWRQRTPSNKTCVEKTSKNANESAISDNDNWLQQKMISRDQIANWWDSLYANPFEQLRELFNDSPLVNIKTKNIYVTVPMVTSDDISAYISLSQNWIDKQERILKDRQRFFSDVIGYCGWSTSINWIEDIQRAFKDLKAQIAESKACNLDWDKDKVANIQKKLQAIEKLKNTYNLSSLWDYKLYEAIDWWFYIYTQLSIEGEIIPYDVYLYYDTPTDELNMFTRWFDLVKEWWNNWEKIKLTIKSNWKNRSNEWVYIKEDNWETTCNSCADMFIDGTLEETLNNFVKMQSSVKAWMKTVKANIETLEQYKQFPLQLYEWIHVTDKYIWDISNLISSTLWTISMWAETNATRYSQYVDAIISIITTLETYQMIIDLSADWSKSCSTCTNDNYDQFSCKLWLICPDGILPVLEIPSTKLPSIYVDFSEIHLETDITLPNFRFTTKAMKWPELPNLPSPPNVDLSMNIDEALSLGMDLVWNLFTKLKAINISFGAGSSLLELLQSIPTIPSPPVLPDLPNFIPTVQMQLPVLPPAPKIPELPNWIKAAIKAAKIIWKILCIVKWKIWLVAEQAVKAKVEQITQRDYEVKLRDNFDQTVSSRNNTLSTDMSPSMARIFSWFAQFLQADKFKEANLKWFDISLKTHIDLQFNFNLFFELVEATTNQINKLMGDNVVTQAFDEMYSWYTEGINMLNEQMQACIDSPFSEACLGSGSELAQQYEQFKQQLQILDVWIHDGFEELNKKLSDLESKKDKVQNLNKEIEDLRTKWTKLEAEMAKIDASNPKNEKTIEYWQWEIDKNNQEISNKEAEIAALQNEISILETEYGEFFNNFKELMQTYESIQNRIWNTEDKLIKKLQNQIDNRNIGSWSDLNLQLSKELETDIKKKTEENEQQKNVNKENRNSNIKNLYRDVDWTIWYVDYNAETNRNNFAILKETLTEINKETTNKELKDKSQEYLTLVTMDREIKANTNSINSIIKNYESIINEYKSNTEQLSNEIINNYDKFLAEASNNTVSLVSDDSFNINLSTQLFDIKEDTLNRLLTQESITKKYMDYNMKNVNWYLNAMENNSAEELNMNEKTYNETKEYLSNIKELWDNVYSNAKAEVQKGKTATESKDETVLIAQLMGWWNWGWNWGSNGWLMGRWPTAWSNNTTVDIANYIDWYTINTEEWIFILANRDYINKFQWRYVLTDINNDNEKDLILRDWHNVYVKYRSDNDSMEHRNLKYYQTYYSYNITSYDELKNRSVDWFVKIWDTWVKLCDVYQEVKNFKYAWQDYDSIRVTRQSSETIWDYVDWYLIKMIQRVDQFNDKENIRNHEDLFDKKYILILPKWAELEWKKLEIDARTTINNIEQEIWTWDWFDIFGINYYSDGIDKLDLTVDVPRHRQYSEIYSLQLYNNTYKISSSSSNQIVAGPQIIADDEWPDPTIRLYRPTTQEYTEWTNLEWYVWTHYILQTEREDNVALDRIWIANTNWETLKELTDINNKTWYIELTGLYFTWSETLQFYAWWEDTNWNSYVVDVKLIIKIPTIEVSDMIQWRQNFINIWNNQFLPDYGSPNLGLNIWFNVNSSVTNAIRQNVMREGANSNTNTNTNVNPTNTNTAENDLYVSIKATLEHDIDSGYVQFLNNRNWDIWNILTWNTNVSVFEATPWNKDVYWWYFTIGNNIGLFSTGGDKIATINPTNWKITVDADNVRIMLDLTYNIPLIKVIHAGTPVFSIKYTSQELVSLDIANDISWMSLDHEDFGVFNWGTALIQNWAVIAYVSPIWQIFVPNETEIIFGKYRFDDNTNSVEYSLQDSNGHRIATVKVRIKNLLDW